MAYQFIFLLRFLHCPTITGLLTSYWKEITKHHCDPKHFTKPLPWNFKDVHDDLISFDVIYLQLTLPDSSSTTMPLAAHCFTQGPTSSTNNKNTTNTSTSKSPTTTTIGIHHTCDVVSMFPRIIRLLHPLVALHVFYATTNM